MGQDIVHIKSMTAKQRCENNNRKYVGSRNADGDHLLKQQIGSSYQQGDHRYLADGSRNVTNEHGRDIHLTAALKHCQRGCSGNTVKTAVAEIGHLSRKGNQQETPGSQSRVHKVLSQTAVQLLYHNNCKDTAQGRDPYRNLRRHVQRQDHSCYKGAAVA